MKVPSSRSPARRAFLRSCLALSLAAAILPARAANPPPDAAAAGVLPGAPRPMQDATQDRARATKSLAYAKQIALACKLYALDNDDVFPPNLDALFPTYLTDKKLLVSPFAPDEAVGYTYHSGLKADAPAATVLLEDKFAPAAIGKIVVHVDGSGEIKK